MLNEYYKQCCLLIFTSNPATAAGWAAVTEEAGIEKAHALYTSACIHLRKVTDHLAMEKRIIYLDSIEENDGWPSPLYSKRLSDGADISSQLADAFEDAFHDGYRKVVMISIDTPELTAKHIEESFLSLRILEYSIGPGSSGSYYLLGMNHFEPSLFEGMPWQTETLLKSTIKQIGNLKEALYKLPVLKQITTVQEQIERL